MADKKRKAQIAKTPAPEIELEPDAWERFESLVKSAAKMGHKPHETKTKVVAKRPKS